MNDILKYIINSLMKDFIFTLDGHIEFPSLFFTVILSVFHLSCRLLATSDIGDMPGKLFTQSATLSSAFYHSTSCCVEPSRLIILALYLLYPGIKL